MKIGTLAVLTLLLSACTQTESSPEQPPEAPAAQASEPASAAGALLAQSISYHDPQSQWSTFSGTLQFEELRPDGATRPVEVDLDVGRSAFEYRTEIDGSTVLKGIDASGCTAEVDGSAPSDEATEGFRLGCDQIERSRNYYLYLWGLPMKLLDPGTHIDPEPTRTEFQGVPVDQIRVTYDEDVGGDIWYFYFEPETRRLVGYRFYHDEAVNDGEYITLEGEVGVGQMRIPARRRWYVNADDRFLGEDVLRGAGGVAQTH